jgi:hypothetical protein
MSDCLQHILWLDAHRLSITGYSNEHTGKGLLRMLARKQCLNYRLSNQKDICCISRELVKAIQEMDPPGRFLKKNGDGVWEEVGVEKSCETASQALWDARLHYERSLKETSAPVTPHHNDILLGHGGMYE